jgi:hypothetical protein
MFDVTVASAKAFKAKANIQLGNVSCGANEPSRSVLGTVSFKRLGSLVTLKVSMKHGEPSTTYEVLLYGNECSFISKFSFVTNTKGVGKGSGSLNVPVPDTEFFAEVTAGKPYTQSDTPYVTLPYLPG